MAVTLAWGVDVQAADAARAARELAHQIPCPWTAVRDKKHWDGLGRCTFGEEKVGALSLEVCAALLLLAILAACFDIRFRLREAWSLVGVPCRADAPTVLIKHIKP